MNEKIKLTSGAMLEMTLLDFPSGLDLFSTISKELLKIDIDLGNINLGNVQDSELGKEFLSTLKNVALTLVVSEELREKLVTAFGRCLYNDQKVNHDTFEDVNARSDYFVVCWEVIKFNITPFLPKNAFGLIEKLWTNTSTPTQK